jgi:hypothetical protein
MLEHGSNLQRHRTVNEHRQQLRQHLLQHDSSLLNVLLCAVFDQQAAMGNVQSSLVESEYAFLFYHSFFLI